MPISGTDPALMVARLGVMRVGASRLNYYQPILLAVVNNVARNSSNVRIDGLTIRDELDGIPNTATVRVQGFVPVEGQTIKLYLGDTSASHLIFAGKILQVTKTYDLTRDHLAYDLSCISWEWLLNPRKVTARYLSESATAIATDLLATYTTGFSAAGVQAGLASIDEITFTNEDLTDCLDRLADRIGGHWVVDYEQVLHFGTTLAPGGSSTAWAITDSAGHGLIAIAATVDLSQVRTRVLVEGGGSQAAIELAPGETLLPLDDASWYDIVLGGTVVSGPQRITYTGVVLGGTGALVGSVPTPTNAPSLALASGAGMGSGIYGYALTFYDGTGETIPGPTDSITTGSQITAPATAPSAVKQLGGNLSAGAYKWKVTYRDSQGGDTTGSAESASVTMDDIAAPTSIGTASDPGFGSGMPSGTWLYKLTFTNGSLETTPSPASNSVTNSGGHTIRLAKTGTSNPPTGFDRQFYRSYNGGAYELMTGPSDGFSGDTADFYSHTTDLSNPAVQPPAVSTAVYRKANVTIPVSADPLVTARRLWRTTAGGSTFRFVKEIADNTTTVTEDNVADADLGGDIPSSNTTAKNRVSLSNIPLGPTGTTGRKIYRTVVNGAQLKLLTTIANNTATTHPDSAADGTLGADAPTSNTSGLTAATGTLNAGATSIPVTGTGPFRSAGGWAQAGGQVLRYTGFSSTALTGVPASGTGSLAATLNYGTEILALPMLTGIPASGAGAIQFTIARGDDVNLLVTRNDVTAQTTLAALLSTVEVPHDGIIEDYIQDRRLSQTEAEARGDARLEEVKDPEVRVQYETRDQTTRSGRDVTITLTAPAISGTFKIQRVTLSTFDAVVNATGAEGRPFPIRQVEASSRRFTLEQLLRLIKAA